MEHGHYPSFFWLAPGQRGSSCICDWQHHTPGASPIAPHEFDGDQGPPLSLTSEKLHTSLPVISLHDDGKDIVYFMTKVHSYHKAALVIAVDMSNKTAQQVTQFLPGKFMERAFVHSRISKFLSMAPALAPRLNYKRKPETTWDDDANSMDVLMNGTVMM